MGEELKFSDEPIDHCARCGKTMEFARQYRSLCHACGIEFNTEISERANESDQEFWIEALGKTERGEE